MKSTGPTLAAPALLRPISKEKRVGKALGLLKVEMLPLSLTRIIIDLGNKFD